MEVLLGKEDDVLFTPSAALGVYLVAQATGAELQHAFRLFGCRKKEGACVVNPLGLFSAP